MESYGYPIEVHEVVTEDGYILTVHRIPPSHDKELAVAKPPVFLGHCMTCSASVWALAPSQSLAYALADNGKVETHGTPKTITKH